jgi:hypothetical protein
MKILIISEVCLKIRVMLLNYYSMFLFMEVVHNALVLNGERRFVELVEPCPKFCYRIL